MTDAQLEGAIGQMLRAGVLLAALIVIVGGAIFLRGASSASVRDYAHFQHGSVEALTVKGIVVSAFHGNGQGIVMLGLLVLIATPVARVLVAGVGFAFERDWPYVGVSTVVMMVLLYSIMFGH